MNTPLKTAKTSLSCVEKLDDSGRLPAFSALIRKVLSHFYLTPHS